LRSGERAAAVRQRPLPSGSPDARAGGRRRPSPAPALSARSGRRVVAAAAGAPRVRGLSQRRRRRPGPERPVRQPARTARDRRLLAGRAGARGIRGKTGLVGRAAELRPAGRDDLGRAAEAGRQAGLRRVRDSRRGRSMRRILRGGESGQALVESGLLLATLLGSLAVGGTWL